MTIQKRPFFFELELDCRHSHAADDEFTCRMRFHQSWYRHHVLNLKPGRNPHAGEDVDFGNILRDDDARAGWNFLNAAIYKHVEARFRLAKNGKPGRVRNNMLASQPMCFNLFAPLADDKIWATALFKKLGLADDIKVECICFEFAPKPAPLQDSTSFDAFVKYSRRGGKRGFIGIEMKLSEPFSQKKYEFEPRYSAWRGNENWWWKDSSEARFAEKQFNQLWRNHLLAFAMLRDADSYDEGYHAVVYHDDDKPCIAALKEYRTHLRDDAPANLVEWPVERIMGELDSPMLTREQREWYNSFRLRYLDLSASEPAWMDFQRRCQ